ncbi:MAG: hypothetical protein DI539_13865 [Flavobacterium psychrophilum]|nr:MAG: hypothetical protein DI539_13865 [Flavobacterium psychrophilum]
MTIQITLFAGVQPFRTKRILCSIYKKSLLSHNWNEHIVREWITALNSKFLELLCYAAHRQCAATTKIAFVMNIIPMAPSDVNGYGVYIITTVATRTFL